MAPDSNDTMLPAATSDLQPGGPTRRLIAVVYYAACILATLQLIRAYFFVDAPYLNAAQYESGTERMPYQARVLMSLVMRESNHSPLVERLASHMRGTLHSPDVFILFVTGLVSMLIIALSVSALYRATTPSGRLAWLPYPLALAIMAETYIVRFQQAIYFPYDLLSVALFTLCIYLAYARRYLLLLPVFVLGCTSRETILLIVLLVLLNIDTLPRITRTATKEIVWAGLLFLLWLPIYLKLNHLYHGNPSESFSRIAINLHTLTNPLQWSQVASAGGFLLLVPFLFWKTVPDARLRRYTLLIPVWAAVIFAVGLINETRVYGELTGLIAVYCTILFERLYLTPGQERRHGSYQIS